MAAGASGAATPKWVIDLHGVKDALSTTSNSVKTRVIDAIRTGEMLVMRSVQRELKELFPALWQQFVAITPKKYVDTPVSTFAAATALQETHGSGVLGGLPIFAHFEAVALSRSRNCKLVSAGKALKSCREIAKQCGIPVSDITDIAAV